MTGYSLWEVIKNGNKVLKRTVGTVKQEYKPTIDEEKQDRRNEMKARATLYGGNKESKKDRRILLKQQKENFAVLSSESLDQTFDSTNNTNNTNKADNNAHGVSTTYTQGNGYSTTLDNLCDAVMLYQAEEEQPTNHTLMAFTSLGSSSSSDYEVDSCSKTCLESVEARLAHYKKNEVVFEESINVLKLKVRLRDNVLNEYKMNLEKAEKERDQLKQTLEKFQNSSKSLNNILESQVIDKFKTGLGYDTSTAASHTVESFLNLTDKSGSNKGYHSVPPPLTGNFIPRKPDLTFVDEIVESENLDVTTVVTPNNAKTVENKGVSNIVESNASRMNNTSAPIIEDWNSDDESEIDYTVRPSTEKIKSVKIVKETDAPKQNK
ncbi:hypothetical protein Tco_1410987 [Tanacetum coccineum]